MSTCLHEETSKAWSKSWAPYPELEDLPADQSLKCVNPT